MATIIFADDTGRYAGPDYEKRPLGGTESSVIQCARELARRGHVVTVYSNCDAPVLDRGVSWLPLNTPTRPETCDLFIACHQPRLFGFVRRPRRLAVWVLWPVSQLKHYKKLWPMWRHRPIPVLMSLYQAQTYSPFLPRTRPRIVLPLGLPDDVRGQAPLASAPPRRAIFASNPQRNLRRLVEIWAQSILPRVPDAVLDVYGLNGVTTHEETWKQWEGTLLPAGLPADIKASVRLHQPLSRADLIRTMRGSRVMLYLGHKAEAFCLSVAEAQALGVPAVVAPLTVLPERVIDGLSGFVRADPGEFAGCAVELLTDDTLWRRQHEAALRHQQGINWSEYAGRLESALLGDRFPIYRSVTALPPGSQNATGL
ncbi:MAG: glycosyltransferase [Verrucomicrobiae bacterium]|nr:glycosyltransferase [Verrucomicrobiae bacterium]